MTWQGQGPWQPPSGPGPSAPVPHGSVLPAPVLPGSVLPGGVLPGGVPPRRRRPAGSTVLAVVAAGLVVCLLAGTSLLILRNLTRPPAPGPAAAPGPARTGPARPAARTGGAAARALPAVLTARPEPGAAPVTPGSAKPVLDALWDLREQAMATRDVDALARFEDGSALFGDSSRARCGCPLRDATRYDEVELYVPRQSRYPVRFLAWTVTPIRDGTPLGELTVITRATAAAPWRISFHTQYVADHVSPLRAGGDQDGFVAPPSKAAHRVAVQAPAALAELWAQAKRTGAVGDLGRFRPGGWTSQEAARYAAHPDGAVQDNGLLSRNRFWADPGDPLFEFTTADGVALACGVVHRRVTYRGRLGRPPVQDDRRLNWGPELAPGRYATVTVDEQSQSCFFVGGEDLGIDVLGGEAVAESVSTGVR